MLRYNPEDAVSCWPDADYPGYLKAAKEAKSKAGNDMWVIDFEAYNGDRSQTVTDYIVFPKGTYKLRHLARALGEEATFKAGKFDPSAHVNDPLTLSLVTESQSGFDDKNRIGSYKPAEGGSSRRQPASAPADEPDVDPDIPF